MSLPTTASSLLAEWTIPDTLQSLMKNASEPTLGYCQRKLLPQERPGHIEILVPPLLIFIILFTGLLALFKKEKRRSKGNVRWKDYLPSRVPDIKCKPEGILDEILEGEDFYSKFDHEVLADLKTYSNQPKELVKICIPAFASMITTTAFMFAQDGIFECVWPQVSRASNINTAVTAFLAPAGLIYALSFGFTFQQALEKLSGILRKVTDELSVMDQMVTMTTKLNMPTHRHVMALLKSIKSEVIFTAMLVQNREASTFTNPPPTKIKVKVWSILDILRDASSHPEHDFNLNVILAERLVSYVIQLNSICTDRMGALHTSIHPLKWIFLEILGSVSLFGVMLVDASSRTMEITLCHLIVFSVTMLCYVLADLDSPFNGFFRVNLDLIPEVVKKIEKLYETSHYRLNVERGLVLSETKVPFHDFAYLMKKKESQSDC